MKHISEYIKTIIGNMEPKKSNTYKKEIAKIRLILKSKK